MAAIVQLTPREKSIAVRLLQAERNLEIAAGLEISARCVKASLARMFLKFGVHDRVTLAVALHKHREELGIHCPDCPKT